MRHLCFLSFTVLILWGCHLGSSNNKIEENSSKGAVTQRNGNVIISFPNAAFPKGIVIDSIKCADDPNQIYSLYLPTTYDSSKKSPIIYFFDPHGVGNLPVRIYKDLAEKYGFILAGTYNSKNGMQFETSNAAANAFMRDSRERLSLDDNRIYTFGFSGGAKVASAVALTDGGVAGVVLCGGGFPENSPQPPADKPFSCIAFVGNRDFNYLQVKQLDKALDATKIAHQLVVYNGKHQWAPPVIAELAFQWLTDKEKYASHLKEMESSGKVKKSLKTEDATDGQEAMEQQELIGDLKTKDGKWWADKVKEMNAQIKKDSTSPTSLIQQRILSLLSLVTYMNASGAFTARQYDVSSYFVNLYALVDPTNPEHSYLSACLDSKSNNSAKALQDLKEAVKLGFNDLGRLQQDSNFTTLHNLPQYEELVKKISAKPEKLDLTK